MLKGITHAAIRTTDIERSIKFYSSIPGVEEQFRMLNDDGSVGMIYMRIAPGQYIEIFPKASGPHHVVEEAGLLHICLEVDDINEMYRLVKEAGIEPNMEPLLAIDYTWQFWIKDPDGIPIEFHQFTPESLQKQEGKPSPWINSNR